MASSAAGAVVLFYWGYVLAKLIRLGRRHSAWRSAALPTQPLERLMWVIWVPTVLAWIALPFVVGNQGETPPRWLAIPVVFQRPPVELLRWMAVAIALAALLMSISCWRFMGRRWRMAVDTDVTGFLTNGPFRWVRHPIYALSMVLMLSTVVAVPAKIMLAVGLVHIMLLWIKAVNEERFLAHRHGTSYSDYAKRTGRFVPRVFG
ncbi:MAG: isoprenylcysteine carboxylmethyltransferase family protein [Phycisphaerae bacterium]|jgi:protein-S-isoprenylcysteine O-methyltransferase Ste14